MYSFNEKQIIKEKELLAFLAKQPKDNEVIFINSDSRRVMKKYKKFEEVSLEFFLQPLESKIKELGYLPVVQPYTKSDDDRILSFLEKYSDEKKVVSFCHISEEGMADYTKIFRLMKKRHFNSMQLFVEHFGYTYLKKAKGQWRTANYSSKEEALIFLEVLIKQVVKKEDIVYFNKSKKDTRIIGLIRTIILRYKEGQKPKDVIESYGYRYGIKHLKTPYLAECKELLKKYTDEEGSVFFDRRTREGKRDYHRVFYLIRSMFDKQQTIEGFIRAQGLRYNPIRIRRPNTPTPVLLEQRKNEVISILEKYSDSDKVISFNRNKESVKEMRADYNKFYKVARRYFNLTTYEFAKKLGYDYPGATSKAES